MRYLLILSCFLAFGVPAFAQGGTYVDTNKTYWHPQNWSSNQDKYNTHDPCTNVSNGAGGNAHGYDNIVGPAGEPSPCTLSHGAAGFMQSMFPALKPMLPYLFGILAVYSLPGLLKAQLSRGLTASKAREAAGPKTKAERSAARLQAAVHKRNERHWQQVTKPERDRVMKNAQRAHSERMANERRDKRFGA